MQFIKLEISNWRISKHSKIPAPIDRRIVLIVFRKCIPNPDLTIEMCIMKEANVSGSSGRSTPMGVNIKLVKCDMDEVCEQKPGQSTWFPYFG